MSPSALGLGARVLLGERKIEPREPPVGGGRTAAGTPQPSSLDTRTRRPSPTDCIDSLRSVPAGDGDRSDASTEPPLAADPRVLDRSRPSVRRVRPSPEVMRSNDGDFRHPDRHDAAAARGLHRHRARLRLPPPRGLGGEPPSGGYRWICRRGGEEPRRPRSAGLPGVPPGRAHSSPLRGGGTFGVGGGDTSAFSRLVAPRTSCAATEPLRSPWLVVPSDTDAPTVERSGAVDPSPSVASPVAASCAASSAECSRSNRSSMISGGRPCE